MKISFFIHLGIIVSNPYSYSQKITTNLLMNGDSNARTIYRSKANTLTIKGTVADSFFNKFQQL